MLNFFTGAVIALLPLYSRVSSKDVLRSSKDLLFINLVIIIMGFLSSKQKREISLKIVLPVLLFCFIGIYNQWEPASINVILQTLSIITGVSFFIYYAKNYDKNDKEILLNCIVFGCLAQSVFAISNYFGYNLYSKFFLLFTKAQYWSMGSEINNGSRGTLGNPNDFAAYMALCLPAFFRPKFIKLLPLPIFAIILSYSLMGVSAVIASVIAFLFFDKIKKYVVELFAAIATLYCIIVAINPLSMVNGRDEIYRAIFSAFGINHLFFGAGAGWLPDMKIVIGRIWVSMEHCDYLSIVNTFGCIGLIAFLYVVLSILKSCECKISFCVIIAFLINMLGNFPMHLSTSVIFFIVFLAQSIGSDLYRSNL